MISLDLYVKSSLKCLDMLSILIVIRQCLLRLMIVNDNRLLKDYTKNGNKLTF